MSDYSPTGGGSGGAIFNADCEWVGIHVGDFSDGSENSIALPFRHGNRIAVRALHLLPATSHRPRAVIIN
jgi:hypothetical protein